MSERVKLTYLLSGRGFLITGALTVGYQLLTEPQLLRVDFWLALLVLFFSQLGLAISLVGFQMIRTRLPGFLEVNLRLGARLTSKLMHWYDLIAMGLSGLLATALAQVSLEAFTHLQSSDFAGAMGGSLLTYGALLPVVAALLGVYTRYRDVGRDVSKHWGQIELTRTRDGINEFQELDPSFRSVAATVVKRLQELQTRAQQDLNQRIQEFISQAVQPVIRDLLAQPGVNKARVFTKPLPASFLTLLKRNSVWQRAHAIEWLFFPGLLVLPFALEFYGWLSGVTFVMATTLWLIGLNFLLPWVMNLVNSIGNRWLRELVGYLYFGSVALVAMLVQWLFVPEAGSLTLAVLLLSWLMVWGGGLLVQLEEDQASYAASSSQLLKDLAWYVADLNTREWFLRKLFARNLPGLAKGELASQLFRLQESNRLQAATPENESLITQLEYRIKHLIALPAHATDVRHELNEIMDAWRAKTSIKFSMDFESAAKFEHEPVAAMATVEVMRELISMAVHLAKASSVESTVTVVSPHEFELRIVAKQDFLKQNEAFDSSSLNKATRFVRECAHSFDYQAERDRAILLVRIPCRVS